MNEAQDQEAAAAWLVEQRKRAIGQAMNRLMDWCDGRRKQLRSDDVRLVVGVLAAAITQSEGDSAQSGSGAGEAGVPAASDPTEHAHDDVPGPLHGGSPGEVQGMGAAHGALGVGVRPITVVGR